MKNITPIVQNNICTQCGICFGVCPHDAINIVQHDRRGLIPIVDDEKCTNCKICVKVCPGDNVDFNQLNEQVFGKKSENEFFGNYSKIVTSFSGDDELRYNGASGGVVTTLLNHLLQEKKIDGAIVVKMSTERPLEPEIFVATTREELISAQQSKYLPVPTMKLVKLILKNPDKKYAIVGLPCHFMGLRKAERYFPKLKKQIVARIGLMCGFNPTLSSTKFLLRRAGVKDFNTIREIKYRDGDWPSGFRVILKDGSNRFLYPIRNFLFSHYLFERHRCAMCTDHMCEFADISVGDEWRKELKQDAAGWSYIIIRTAQGEKLVNDLIDNKIIYAEEITEDVIFSGQGSTTVFKKRGTKAFANIVKLTGGKVPTYLEESDYKPKFRYYLGAFLVFTVSKFFEIGLINRLFLWTPTKVFTKYRHILMRIFKK